MSSHSKAFKTELRDFLLASSGIAALVGNRIFATQAAQRPNLPYLVFFTVTASETKAHDGPTGNEEYRIQIDVYSDTVAGCEELRDLIKSRLNGIRTNWETVRVQSCFFDNEFDEYDDTAKVKQKTMDFIFRIADLVLVGAGDFDDDFDTDFG